MLQGVGGAAAERAAGGTGDSGFDPAAAMETIRAKEWHVSCSAEVVETLV
ncbi:MAG TPA: hypothetical protein P5159_25885 [Phycisphaerae bacterium]|nr:hypothetical protein [Phycisphaerae bacterium]